VSNVRRIDHQRIDVSSIHRNDASLKRSPMTFTWDCSPTIASEAIDSLAMKLKGCIAIFVITRVADN